MWARVLLAEGPAALDAVEGGIDEAERQAEARGWIFRLAELEEVRAALEARRGDEAAAQEHLAEARRRYAEMGAYGHVARLDARAGVSMS